MGSDPYLVYLISSKQTFKRSESRSENGTLQTLRDLRRASENDPIQTLKPSNRGAI